MRGATHKADFSVRRSVIYNDSYYQEGDIVAIKNDGKTYYAQVRAFLRSPDAELSVGVLWLIPKCKTNGPFRLEHYKIGKATYITYRYLCELTAFLPFFLILEPRLEEFLYKMDVVKFVMHCPLEYYLGPLASSVDGDDANFGRPVVYCRVGDPLIRWEKVSDGKKEDDCENGRCSKNISSAIS